MSRKQGIGFPGTVRCEPRTEEARKQLRKSGIGASEIPALLGLSLFTTAKDVWREKNGIAVFEGNEFTRLGQFFEPHFFAYLKRYYFPNRETLRNTGIYVVPGEPHFCTPDGFLFESRKSILLELKISSYFSKKKFACAEAQVQYTMHLLDLDEAMICVLQGTKVELIRIPRKRSEGEKYREIARDFWSEYVVKNTEPPESLTPD